MADLPDFFSPFVVKGWDGAAYKTLRVTNLGELYILLSALDGVTVTPLHCDAQGNAFFNVKAQDLAEVINRPKYGNAQQSIYQGVVPGLLGIQLITVAGKGITYGGWVAAYGGSISHKNNYIDFAFDHTGLYPGSFEEMNKYGITQQPGALGSLSFYDDTNYIYAIILPYGITFETLLILEYQNAVNDPVTVRALLTYALI